MHVVTVVFTVADGAMGRFLPLMRGNAALSLEREAGCLRFDVCVGTERAEQVFLYEIYDSAASFEAHLVSAHFLEFQDAVAGLVAEKSVRRWSLTAD